MNSQKSLIVPHYAIPHSAFSVKQGREVADLVVSLKTGKRCAYGQCRFCGLNDTKGEELRAAPLSAEELSAQVRHGISKAEGKVEKISLVSTVHSTLTKDVVDTLALAGLINFAAGCGIRELSFETRMDLLLKDEMKRVLPQLRSIARQNVLLEIACEVESPDEHERLGPMNNGLTDAQLRAAAKEILANGFGLRAYHIFMPPTGVHSCNDPYVHELVKLLRMIKLFASLKERPEDRIQLWINLGYRPHWLRGHVSPDLENTLETLELASPNALFAGIPLHLDLLDGDIKIAGSGTKRPDAIELRRLVAERNASGWLG